MDDFEITPYEGAGPIQLGMSREDVRAAMNSKATQFLKTADSTVPDDHFQEQGIVVSYTDADEAETIEFFGPANPTYGGQQLLGLSEAGANSWIEDVDPEADIESDPGNEEMTSTALGIALWLHPPAKGVKSVLVFVEGYYD